MKQPANSRDRLTYIYLSLITRRRLADKRFSNESYFSHFFRHHIGMTPTEFRRHLKG